MKNACYVSFLLVLAFAFSQLASALPEPNLSGTWVINQINGQAVADGSHPVSIAQKGNEFVVEYDRRSPMMKQEYVTDGTERKLTQIGTPTLTYYTAKWEGETLIIDKTLEDTRPWPGPMRLQDIDSRHAISSREVWSISLDGKTLTRLTTTRFGTSPNKSEFTLTYAKVDTQ
jgi:hypothetical protein